MYHLQQTLFTLGRSQWWQIDCFGPESRLRAGGLLEKCVLSENTRKEIVQGSVMIQTTDCEVKWWHQALKLTVFYSVPQHPHVLHLQIKKTSEATLTTIQDMVTIEDYDVSECFHHSRSTESVKSTVSETYLSKPSIAKRRANQQETEQFYFMVRGEDALGYQTRQTT